MNKYTICWKKKALRPDIRQRIIERFGFPIDMTVNGETVVSVRDEDSKDFMAIVERGFIEIRNK
jgi:hypothetical protein